MALGLPNFVLYVWGGCIALWFLAILMVLLRAGIITCCRRHARKSVTQAARRVDRHDDEVDVLAVDANDIFVPTDDDRRLADETFIERGAINIGKELAQISRVSTYKAILKLDAENFPSKSGSTRKVVCCRMVGDKASDVMHNLFEHELYLMLGLKKHNAVVHALGAFTTSEPHLLVIEYLPRGNLRDLLRFSRIDKTKRFRQRDQLQLMAQVANGMDFLSRAHVAHCNLSLANVWVGASNTAKVANLIAARRMTLQGSRMCYRRTDHSLVINFKWQAPEVLTERVFTTASDVWAFGVCLWELATLGGSPYPKFAPEEVLDNVARGKSMTKLPHLKHTSSTYWCDLIENCWLADAKKRPSFEKVRNQLLKMSNSGRSHLPYPDKLPTFGDPFDSMKLSDVLEVIGDDLRVPDPASRPLPAVPDQPLPAVPGQPLAATGVEKTARADRPLPPVPANAAPPPQDLRRKQSIFRVPDQDENFGALHEKNAEASRARIVSHDDDYESPDEDASDDTYEMPELKFVRSPPQPKTAETSFTSSPRERAPTPPRRPSRDILSDDQALATAAVTAMAKIDKVGGGGNKSKETRKGPSRGKQQSIINPVSVHAVKGTGGGGRGRGRGRAQGKPRASAAAAAAAPVSKAGNATTPPPQSQAAKVRRAIQWETIDPVELGMGTQSSTSPPTHKHGAKHSYVNDDISSPASPVEDPAYSNTHELSGNAPPLPPETSTDDFDPDEAHAAVKPVPTYVNVAEADVVAPTETTYINTLNRGDSLRDATGHVSTTAKDTSSVTRAPMPPPEDGGDDVDESAISPPEAEYVNTLNRGDSITEARDSPTLRATPVLSDTQSPPPPAAAQDLEDLEETAFSLSGSNDANIPQVTADAVDDLLKAPELPPNAESDEMQVAGVATVPDADKAEKSSAPLDSVTESVDPRVVPAAPTSQSDDVDVLDDDRAMQREQRSIYDLSKHVLILDEDNSDLEVEACKMAEGEIPAGNNEEVIDNGPESAAASTTTLFVAAPEGSETTRSQTERVSRENRLSESDDVVRAVSLRSQPPAYNAAPRFSVADAPGKKAEVDGLATTVLPPALPLDVSPPAFQDPPVFDDAPARKIADASGEALVEETEDASGGASPSQSVVDDAIAEEGAETSAEVSLPEADASAEASPPEAVVDLPTEDQIAMLPSPIVGTRESVYEAADDFVPPPPPPMSRPTSEIEVSGAHKLIHVMEAEDDVQPTTDHGDGDRSSETSVSEANPAEADKTPERSRDSVIPEIAVAAAADSGKSQVVAPTVSHDGDRSSEERASEPERPAVFEALQVDVMNGDAPVLDSDHSHQSEVYSMAMLDGGEANGTAGAAEDGSTVTSYSPSEFVAENTALSDGVLASSGGVEYVESADAAPASGGKRTMYTLPPPFQTPPDGVVVTEAILSPPTKTGTLVISSAADAEEIVAHSQPSSLAGTLVDRQ